MPCVLNLGRSGEINRYTKQSPTDEEQSRNFRFSLIVRGFDCLQSSKEVNVAGYIEFWGSLLQVMLERLDTGQFSLHIEAWYLFTISSLCTLLILYRFTEIKEWDVR